MDLFAYGSLMVAEVMRGVCGHAGGSTPAVLHGYRRRRLVHEVYPAILLDSAEYVEGVVYQGLSDRELAALDAFEGVTYRRTWVEVRVGRVSRAVETYVLAPGCEHLLGEEDWSLQAFIREGLPAFVGSYPGFGAVADREAFDDAG